MGTQKNKAAVAWLVTVLLERDKAYSPGEIDLLIRDSIRPGVLLDPQYAPDHIRLAMVENGFVVRDAAGTTYRIHPRLQLPNENESMYRRLNEESLNANPMDMIRCPMCAESFIASAVVLHFLRQHRLAGKWESLLDSYGR